MAVEWRSDDEFIDPTVKCENCDAVCCRLTVMVMPEDKVPRHLVDIDDKGIQVMARGEDGWCIALDHQHMRCGIYDLRPGACRRFTMGAGYCRDEREAYRSHYASIPLVVIETN
jgi:uncharacterized protein